MSGKRLTRSTHTPTGRPTTHDGTRSASTSNDSSKALALSMRMAVNGSAMRVMRDPNTETVSAAQKRRKPELRHRPSNCFICDGPNLIVVNVAKQELVGA